MAQDCFAPGVKLQPYWWDEAPRPDLAEAKLPSRVDVAIVGAGYTGLAAGMVLARAGRSVLICDAEAAGWGASSRNQGHIGIMKRPFAEMERTLGRKLAVALMREGQDAVDYTKDFIQRENIRCYLKTNGRFIAAANKGHYEALGREVEILKREIGFEADMIPRAEQHKEIGSDLYFGGEVRHKEASLHGGLFHQGLLDRAQASGVQIAAHTPVTGIGKESGGFEITTPRGKVSARDVLVATNGYTRSTRALPWFRRRIIPIGAYGFATEPMAREQLASLIPNDRAIIDTWKLSHSLRPAPDNSRLIGGGRVSMTQTDVTVTGPRLHKFMVQVFPQLKGVRFTHTWTGFVAYTFQTAPHLGVYEGLHYCMGFCGYGVALAPYLGWKVAQKIMGGANSRSPFEELPFETRPFYDGNPWFLPATVAWYAHQDRKAVRAG